MESIDMGLFVTISAVVVAGLAAVLGIWMERDKNKPPRYAWALSALIVMTTLVSLAQSYLDEQEQNELQEDMARLLVTMDKLAGETDDPRLAAMVQSELSAQSRSNPDVMDKVVQRVADAGEDPAEMLGKHLGEAEVEKVARTGHIKPKARPKVDKPEPAPEPAAAPAAVPAAGRAGRAGAEPAGEPAAVPAAAPVPAEGEAVPVAATAPTGRAGRAGGAAPAGEAAPAPAMAPVPKPEPAAEPAKGGRTKPARGGR